MNILIKDDQGLDTALMMEGYTQDQRMEAKQEIRAQFRTTAAKVFQEILDKPLPENMVINMAISDRAEVKGEGFVRLASYNVALSRKDSAVFTIREVTVKTILDHKDRSLFETTVTHEMFHAADKNMLENSHKLLDAVRDDIYDETDRFSHTHEDGNIALLRTLQFFNHYRAEGVAILGESLLSKNKFGNVENAIEQFCSVFKFSMMRAQMRTGGDRTEKEGAREYISHKAYAVAPIILMLVLQKRGDIDHLTATKALKGLATGNYELEDDDIIKIMRSALALTLAGFIQGLMGLGDDVAPIRPFLKFCASLQHDWDEDNINAYEQLIQNPESEAEYNAAMSQIMGSCMSEEELDSYYRDFMESDIDTSQYPQMKEKLTRLYDVFKQDGNPERSRLAQWALTYFFDDEDLIHDDVSGMGLVDDMTIIDYAIRLLF